LCNRFEATKSFSWLWGVARRGLPFYTSGLILVLQRMQMNKLIVGAVALVAVGGGGVGIASWSGDKIASGIQASTAKVLQIMPGVKLVDQKFTKGLTRSTHELTIAVGCQDAQGAAEPLQFIWRDQISHGPLPGGKDFGLAAMDSELVLPPKWQAQVTKVFGDKPLFTAHTVVGFGGGYTSELRSPALKHTEKDTTFDWQGLTLVTRGDLQRGIAAGGSFTLEMPGLTVTNTGSNGPGNLKLGRVTMQSQMQPTTDPALWITPAQGEGKIESIAFSVKPPMGKPVVIAMDGLTFKQHSKIDNSLMSSSSQFSGKARVNDFAIDKLELHSAINKLHVPTYQQMISRVLSQALRCDKAAKNPAELDKIMLEESQKDLMALLSHGLEYAVDKLAIEIGGKNAELSYKLGTTDIQAADASAPVQELLTTKGYAHVGMKVQLGWIEQVVQKTLAARAADKGSKPSAEEASQIMANINKVVDKLVAKGFVIREGETLTSQAKFQKGAVTVNDKPMGLGDLMGAM
jgi:uncharacterized protein YdgA (DUF945 family)